MIILCSILLNETKYSKLHSAYNKHHSNVNIFIHISIEKNIHIYIQLLKNSSIFSYRLLFNLGTVIYFIIINLSLV